MTLPFPVRPGELDATWLSEALDWRIDGFQLHEDGRRLADTPWPQSMTFQGRIDNLALLVEQGWPRLIEICGDLGPVP